ncbi:hypothetical protein Tco_0884990 [Tanacetum coccineum]
MVGKLGLRFGVTYNQSIDHKFTVRTDGEDGGCGVGCDGCGGDDSEAAGGYEVEGGDVDDGGVVVVVRGMVMMMTVVAGCGCRRGVEARGGEWIWGSGRSGHEDNIWFRPERSPKNFSGGGGMVAGGKGGRKFLGERER